MGFEDLKGLSKAELYVVLTDLANTRTNAFGFNESGQQIYDLAEGLKFGVLTPEDIVGSGDLDGIISDFVEEVKDDGISPEMINEILVDKFHVGKKLEIDKTGKARYVKDDGAPQDFEVYLRKPEVEVKPEIKEDFTEKILMVKLKEKSDNLGKEYPELFGKDTTIDDAVALKKKLLKEKAELEDKIKEDGVKEGYSKQEIEYYVNNLLEDLEKKDDFVDAETLKSYNSIKGKLKANLQEILLEFNDKGE